MSETTIASADSAAIETLKTAVGKVRDELGKVIIGQDEVIEQALIAIFTRSHALLVGVPGLAKTLLISSLAETLHLTFKRIQFTPDLMPSDITGTEVIYNDPATGEREFKFLRGSDLRQHRPRGRDQPHAAEDPGRHAGVDAGAQGLDRRRRPPAARSVLRPGDAEPDRAGGYLPASRKRSWIASCSASGSSTRARRRSSRS